MQIGHNFATGLPIDVMFGSKVGFQLSLDFYHRAFIYALLLRLYLCVSWAFLLSVLSVLVIELWDVLLRV